MDAFYEGRLQSWAKHKILGDYLEKLAYKIFSWADSLDYVDGFSGPWENSDTERFSDTSFAVAITVLKKVQQGVLEKFRKRVRIRCVLVEKDRTAFDNLRRATSNHDAVGDSFLIQNIHGSFEEVADEIAALCDHQFRMVFIDPTGWTGFDLNRLPRLLKRPRTEVMFNFMHRFISRFINDPTSIENGSFDGLLGSDWRETLPGPPYDVEETERLFRSRLRNELAFTYVPETPVFEQEKDAILYKLVFGTSHPEGLKVFRDVASKGSVRYDESRRRAKSGGQLDIFEAHGIKAPCTGPFQRLVLSDQTLLNHKIEEALKQGGPMKFDRLWPPILEEAHVTMGDVQKAVVSLAKAGRTAWKPPGSSRRVPAAGDVVRLVQT